jgi:signal transduction histidine kinase
MVVVFVGYPAKITLLFILIIQAFFLVGKADGLRWTVATIFTLCTMHFLLHINLGYSSFEIILVSFFILIIYTILTQYENQKNENYELLRYLNDNLDSLVAKRTDELLIAKQKAEVATRLKSEFLANVSHEIRTPMNGIIGMTNLALQTSLDEKQKNYLEKIDSSANALLGLINNILDFSQMDEGKLELDKKDFNLLKIVHDVSNQCHLRAKEKNLNFTTEYNIESGNIYFGDDVRLEHILMHLIDNAIKFTNSGEIGLVVSESKDNKVRFEVWDTGIGMSSEHTQKLFESFTQIGPLLPVL